MEYKPETKNCQNCKKDFMIEPEDFGFYEKIKVTVPNWCSVCRFMRRMTWRNERSLYHRECARCNNQIISIYSKEKPFPIYCNSCWWSDEWDPLDYGIPYDPKKDFFVQLEKLFNKVPHLALPSLRNKNCEYTSWLDECKDCYMTFGSSRCEDVLFSETLQDCKYSMDLTNCDSVDYSYNSVYCRNSNNVQYCVNSDSCIDCYFCFDLKGCQNCFLSYNLRHKSYMILNKQYSPEDWKKEVDKILGNREPMKESLIKFKELIQTKAIHRFATIQKSYNSTGNNLTECKRASDCFDSKMIEDCQHVTYGGFSKDCADLFGVMKSELCYEGFSVSESSYCVSSPASWGQNTNVSYSQFLGDCHNVFGCNSIRKKSFCVLNRQYTEEEYRKIIREVEKDMRDKGYYGSFFPIEISPYGYNETMANVYFPLGKEEALKKGYQWQENTGGVFGKATISVKDLPSSVRDTNEDILKEIIECVKCEKNFKIIKQELDSYRKLNIPIPEECIDCRFKKRLELYLPRNLYHRKCMREGCNNEFETPYAPGRSEIIYCETCYQKEVY